MKTTPPNPEDPKLGALLRESRAAPVLPPRFHEGVWRRIEQGESRDVRATWLDSLVAFAVRPKLAWAVAAVMLVAGAALGAREGVHAARQDAQERYLAAVAPDALR